MGDFCAVAGVKVLDAVFELLFSAVVVVFHHFDFALEGDELHLHLEVISVVILYRIQGVIFLSWPFVARL